MPTTLAFIFCYAFYDELWYSLVLGREIRPEPKLLYVRHCESVEYCRGSRRMCPFDFVLLHIDLNKLKF